MKAPSTALAKLIKDSREALDLSQAELAKKVGVQSAVNISKWESGGPVPWHRLDSLLKALPNVPADHYWSLVKKYLPDAMQRYQSNRQKRDEGTTREAPSSVLDFMSPRVREKMKSLHSGSPYVSVETLMAVACEWYADLATEHGLRSDLTPNIEIASTSFTERDDLEPPNDTSKKLPPGDQSRKVSRRG